MFKKFVWIAAAAFIFIGCTDSNKIAPPLPQEPQPWQWQRMADFGGPPVWFSKTFTIGNRAYVGTGYDPTTAFWQYNQDNNTWIRKADFAGSARGSAVGFAVGEKGYIGLGWDANGQCLDLWEYDPAADRWTSKSPLPAAARDHAAAFVIGAKAYIAGGTMGGGVNAVFLKEVWEYDPSLDHWTRKGDMPEGAATPASFVLNGKGYLGTGILGDSPQVLSKSFWEFDPPNDAWTRKADFPGTARYIAVGFVAGNRGYIGTGMETYSGAASSVFNDIWEYDPQGDAWTQKPAFSGAARGGAVAFVLDSCVYIGTGADSGNRILRDFWRTRPSASADASRSQHHE
jgi:N-acetylneuraminic acid mutarotase